MFYKNKGREELCASLIAMGVDARAVEGRDRPEAITSGFWQTLAGGGESLGVIEIGKGPISWIHVTYDYSSESGPYYETNYGVPDERSLPNLNIRVLRVKNFPIFGKVTDIQWQGEDHGLGIGLRLGNDLAIKSTIMEKGFDGGLRIVANSNHRCWLIRHATFYSSHIPSAEKWSCYQTIAKHLLQVPVPGQQSIS